MLKTNFNNNFSIVFVTGTSCWLEGRGGGGGGKGGRGLLSHTTGGIFYFVITLFDSWVIIMLLIFSHRILTQLQISFIPALKKERK